MADFFHALSQVPFFGIVAVLFVSLGVVWYFSDERKSDVLRYVKGVIVTVILSVVVFFTAVIPKYFGYFKVDVMQLGGWGVGFLAVLSVLLLGVKTMAVGQGRSGARSRADLSLWVSRVPYPLRQVVLFGVFFGYFMSADTGLDVSWIVAGVLPLNVIYHLYCVKVLDRLFAFALRLNERFDERFMAKTVDQ